MTEEDSKKQSITNKLQKHRSYQTAEALAGSLWAKDYRLYLYALIDIALTLAVVYIVDRLVLNNYSDCTIRCTPNLALTCCGWSGVNILRLGILLLISFCASFIATKVAKGMWFARSSLFSALLLIVVSLYLLIKGAPFSMIGVTVIGLVLVTFGGYRLAFSLR